MSDQVRQAEQDNKGTTDIFAGYGAKDQELSSYAALAALFNLIFAVFLLVVRGTGRTLPERVETKDIILLGVAAHKLSFVVSNDAVTSVIRAPFTERQDKQSPKSIDEKPRGSGLRRSIGELLTCPFCLAQWVATGFTYGMVFAPRATRLATSMFTAIAASDFLQYGYAATQQKVEG